VFAFLSFHSFQPASMNTSLFICVILFSILGYSTCLPVPRMDESGLTLLKTSTDLIVSQPYDSISELNITCVDCFKIMVDILDDLVDELANGGVIGGCLDVCGALNKSVVIEGACDALCLFVGVKEFIKIVNQTDPDPIYVCQLLKKCPMVAGGAAVINSFTITPTTGPKDTLFTTNVNLTVTNATSTGWIAFFIVPQKGVEVPFGEVVPGLTPATYPIAAQIDSSQLSEGDYQLIFQLCAGDCTTRHPYGGVYAQSQLAFNITKKTF